MMRHYVRWRVFSGIWSFVLVGCTGTPASVAIAPSASPVSSDATIPVARYAVVATPGTPVPAGCRPDAVSRVVDGFIDAFNRGDQAQLGRFFGPRFLFYAVNDRDAQGGNRSFVAYAPSQRGSIVPDDRVTAVPQTDLLAYFADRHLHHERLALQTFGGSYAATTTVINFGMRLVRTADDLPAGLGGPGHLAGSKGGMDCTDGTFIGMTMWEKSGDPADPSA